MLFRGEHNRVHRLNPLLERQEREQIGNKKIVLIQTGNRRQYLPDIYQYLPEGNKVHSHIAGCYP